MIDYEHFMNNLFRCFSGSVSTMHDNINKSVYAEESSDAQSMENESAEVKMHDLGFPSRADQKKLTNLLKNQLDNRNKTLEETHLCESSSAVHCPGSKSSDSEANSPRTSVCTDSVFSESINSSIRNSARSLSAVSSERDISIVTDFDTVNMHESPRASGPINSKYSGQNGQATTWPWQNEESSLTSDSEHELHSPSNSTILATAAPAMQGE